MFVKLKPEKVSKYTDIFQDPSTIREVWMHDLSGTAEYYMVQIDKGDPENYKGDRTGNKIFYEKPGIEWINGRAKGFVHLRGDEVELVEVDNESLSEVVLESWQSFC